MIALLRLIIHSTLGVILSLVQSPAIVAAKIRFQSALFSLTGLDLTFEVVNGILMSMSV